MGQSPATLRSRPPGALTAFTREHLARRGFQAVALAPYRNDVLAAAAHVGPQLFYVRVNGAGGAHGRIAPNLPQQAFPGQGLMGVLGLIQQQLPLHTG